MPRTVIPPWKIAWNICTPIFVDFWMSYIGKKIGKSNRQGLVQDSSCSMYHNFIISMLERQAEWRSQKSLRPNEGKVSMKLNISGCCRIEAQGTQASSGKSTGEGKWKRLGHCFFFFFFFERRLDHWLLCWKVSRINGGINKTFEGSVWVCNPLKGWHTICNMFVAIGFILIQRKGYLLNRLPPRRFSSNVFHCLCCGMTQLFVSLSPIPSLPGPSPAGSTLLPAVLSPIGSVFTLVRLKDPIKSEAYWKLARSYHPDVNNFSYALTLFTWF